MRISKTYTVRVVLRNAVAGYLLTDEKGIVKKTISVGVMMNA